MQGPYVIVVGIDFEPDGDLAFDEALKLAAARGNAELHALHVATAVTNNVSPNEKQVAGVSPRTIESETILDRMESFANARITLTLAGQPELTFNRVVTHFRLGKPANMLVQLAVDLDADLVVVGTHNRKGIKRLVLGSVAETVVHQARCPVVVVRPKDHSDLGEVPEIEPPCEACLQTRAATDGAEMWCQRHALAKYRPRVHKVMRGASGREPEPWSQATPEV